MIQPQNLSSVFDQFFTADHLTGTGIGLHLTHEFVGMHKGSIRVESEPGKGTKFTVEIPLELASEEDICKKELPEQTFMTDRNIRKRILLAEDNELNMEVTKFILESAGATVVLVENGERCVKEFRASEEGEFDAVLMDIMMPIMDGLEATACIRALEREDAMTVPIIAMTAKAFVDDRQKSFAAGMNEHLAKPLEAKEIIKTLVKFVVQD